MTDNTPENAREDSGETKQRFGDDRQHGASKEPHYEKAITSALSTVKTGTSSGIAEKSCSGFLDDIRALRARCTIGMTSETRSEIEGELKNIRSECAEAKSAAGTDENERKAFENIKEKFDTIAKEIETELRLKP